MTHVPSLLAGHLGVDHISGALLIDETRAVQTLSKVSPLISPVSNACVFAVDRHSVLNSVCQ